MKIRVSGVPATVFLRGTKVVHPVHLGHSSMTHRQWSTTRKVHIASAMIVVDGHGDSSWHTKMHVATTTRYEEEELDERALAMFVQ